MPFASFCCQNKVTSPAVVPQAIDGAWIPASESVLTRVSRVQEAPPLLERRK